MPDQITPDQTDIAQSDFYAYLDSQQTLSWDLPNFGSLMLEVDECNCGSFEIVDFVSKSSGGVLTLGVTLEAGLHRLRLTNIEQTGSVLEAVKINWSTPTPCITTSVVLGAVKEPHPVEPLLLPPE